MLCIFHLTHKNKFKEKLKYFILSDDIINVIVFLISFSDTCECIEMQLIFICWFIFCNFTKVICSNNCFMEPLNFLYIRPYDLQTGIILLYPFWTGCLYFIFFNLITLARTLSTILKRTGENGYFCLIPDLRERAIKFSSLSRMVSVGFGVIYNLYYVEMHTIPSLLRVFFNYYYYKQVMNFVKCFSCITKANFVIFILYHINWFSYIEKSLHSRDKFNLVME